MSFEINNQHRLLKRQLRNFPDIPDLNSEQCLALLNVVNETYHQVDRERRLLENAIEVTAQELTGVNKQLQLFIENAPTGIVMLDSQLRYLYASRRWLEDRKLLGIDIIGKSHYELSPNISEDKKRMLQKCLLGESASCNEDRIIYSDGTYGWIRWEVKPWLGADGDVGGLIIFSEDITARKSAEEELRIASVAFQSSDGMIVTDHQGNILRVNSAFEKISGYVADELVGKKTSIFKSPEYHDDAFYRNLWEAVSTEGKWEGSVWNRNKEGRTIPVWLSISAVRGLDGTHTHYIGIYSNTSDPREAERKILELAYYDPLTNLPNRRLLLDRLNQARLAATRNHVYGAILIIDIDRFKSINDTRGHDMGDQVLMAVAQSLRSNLREMDTAARLGGDEFVVLIPDLGPNAENAMYSLKLVADKLHKSISEPVNLNGIIHTTTSSIGIALFSDKTQGTNELLKEADLALYQAKAAGRNTIQFFNDAMHIRFTEKMTMEASLKRAMDKGELSLMFQPQVDKNGHVVGAEALLRWSPLDNDVIPPDVFIPVAEEAGLITSIGEWALNGACDQLKRWSQNESTSKLALSVNISAKQFRAENFANMVQAAVNSAGINPGLLKLELTESLLLDNVDAVISTMNALRNFGVKFSMDDFGTGYSSLSYLKRLPLDELKIDKSFVLDIAWDEGDRAIIRSILSLAQTLKLRVVAEGVETIEQRDYLLAEGCCFYQGYLYGKPLSEESFQSLLSTLQ
ncbi:bifunctional diguanylate cyclase/phosphodiesterase [Polynucleobacter sp. MWH-Braz-FAM2G]|uniref:sensor domain-containing protein n=1 Tax=Polynucleobacter sp. MWH-Braz-FAM2G TaxID=1855883 RepID=UPI001BFE0EB5|nr:bifunctional diguanylate cyclase/phosphodiesterase [Polynucleobacter sp. MWH-Braz-FAM2G]QWD89996.1 EAL domain-containing protein [Polynucleobacter sp. MWH-Braz-FAM2G]